MLLSLCNWPLKSLPTMARKWPPLWETLGGGRPSRRDHGRITYGTCATCKFCIGYMRKRVAALLLQPYSPPSFVMTQKPAVSQTLNGGNIFAFHAMFSLKKKEEKKKKKEETKPNQIKSNQTKPNQQHNLFYVTAFHRQFTTCLARNQTRNTVSLLSYI